MGNGYNNHFQYQESLNNFQKSNTFTFLPMLCSSSRTSIKDVALPRLEDRSSFSNDPLSPKIGCMGQVKRHNKIIGFPTTSHNTNNKLALTSSSNGVKYFKLKRLFSAKNINGTNINNSNSTSSTRRSRREVTTTESGVCINIAEMDPPLPVIKRAATDHQNNLWKRRSNGGALKTLELQHIQIPRYQVEIQSV